MKYFFKDIEILYEKAPMMWTIFPGPWRDDGKGLAYIRCTNYSFL